MPYKKNNSVLLPKDLQTNLDNRKNFAFKREDVWTELNDRKVSL